VTIHGNVINGVTNSGIGLTYCNYVNVHGNIIIDANQGANGTGSSITNAGICVYVNANYVDIKDNQISGSSMQYGINFQTATGAQHQTYRNNVIVGVNTADYRNSYAAAPSAGTWARGERVFYTPSVVDGNNMVLQGWVCTVAGSPGTWVTQYISTVSPAN
jgi:nitrous oxidase accessory protein NosD